MLSTTPAEPGERPRRLSGRDAERVLAAQLLEAFNAHAQTSTDFMARLGGRLVNDVLLVESQVFDVAATPIFRQFHVAAGSVLVDNQGANDMTVHAAGPSAGAPTGGVGVTIVPKGQRRMVALASRQFTIYGVAADKVSFQVFTAVPTPVVS